MQKPEIGNQYSVFRNGKTNYLEETVFLGESVSVSRYDEQKYPIFEKLIEKQLSFFWRPEEIDISRDRGEFQNLPPHEQHIFLSNLKYQTLLDSIQGRSPNLAFLPVTSLPEFETWVETWSFSECLVPETEVLTSSGWKAIPEVTTDDFVACYNKDTSEIIFSHPKATIERDHKGKMYEFDSLNFHQIVTPGHRMLVRSNDNPVEFVEAEKVDYNHSNAAITSGLLESGHNISMTTEERLKLALCLGGVVSDIKEKSVVITMTTQSEDQFKHVYSVAEAYGRPMFVKNDPVYENIRTVSVELPGTLQDVREWWTLEGWVDLNNISDEWCLQFIRDLVELQDAICKLDGFTVESHIEKNIDIIQAVVTLGEHRAVKYQAIGDDGVHSYMLAISAPSHVMGDKIKKTEFDYDGKVYCLNTTTGAFVVRSNGVVSVSGNCIHSRSYTHIIRGIIDHPEEVFNDIVINPNIVARAEARTKHYDDMIEYARLYEIFGEGHVINLRGQEITLKKRDLQKKIYLVLNSVNVLEGISFYVSFLCSWAFAERELMEGNAKIIKLIARDEQLHATGTTHLINILKSGREGSDWAEVAAECEEEVLNIFKEGVELERGWIEYLFQYGSMMGLNANILTAYLEYITNDRLKSIGFAPMFPERTTNPVPWVRHWLSSDDVQVAPQEVEITSYLVSQLDVTIDEKDFAFTDI